MQKYHGEFPWSITEYHEWAAAMYDEAAFRWLAAPDLACEPAFDEYMSVTERITQTVENTVALLDHDPGYPVLPVLQGRTISEWVSCYDALCDQGIDPSFAGIGTLCRQQSGGRIADIVRALRVRTGIDAFHGFGVKATAFKAGTQLASADSQAWTWPLKYGLRLEYAPGSGLRRVPYSDSDTNRHCESFDAYYRHVSRLQRDAWNGDGRRQASVLNNWG